MYLLDNAMQFVGCMHGICAMFLNTFIGISLSKLTDEWTAAASCRLF